MFGEEDQEQKTEQATQKKRDEARGKGMVASSIDLTHAVQLSASLVALGMFGPLMMNAILTLGRSMFGHLDTTRPLSKLLNEDAPRNIAPIIGYLCAISGAAIVAGIAVGMAQTGLLFSSDLLEPKWERLNPVAAFGKLFSLSSLQVLLIGSLKLAVVTWCAYQTFASIAEDAPTWWRLSLLDMFPLCCSHALRLAWRVVTPMFILGAADYGYKRWKMNREIMMTKQEVKEEHRQSDGDPAIKQRIRQLQFQRAARRMMKNVPKASVVIANPTHVAIALMYTPGKMAAPVVVAKGEHLIAQRIKAIAAEHGVPVIEEPPLARALLRTTKVGEQIPMEFYRAVAEVLAVLYRRKNRAVLPALPGRPA